MILRLIIGGVVFLACLWLAGLGAFTAIALSYPATIDKNYTTAIVLTGGKNRVTTGLDLLSQSRVEKIFITGVYENTTMDDIRGLASDADALPNCCIILGREATTTRENAIEANTWFRSTRETQTPLLITSSYHMPRALLAFSDISPDPLAVTSMRDDDDPDLKFLMREYHKTLYRLIETAIFGH